MSAVAGMIDLTGRRPVPVARLEEMVQAMSHRGPDEQDLWHEPGIGIGLRRLQVGNSDRRRPMGHPQNRSIVALDGTLFNKEQISSRLQSQGHTPNSGGDDELLQHLWEAKGEKLLDMIEGQFAFALWNRRERRLILARDRFGIRPLHWAQNDGWLLFASEIKGLLASGVVEPRADLRGLSQVFTFFGLPGPVTCFQGISAIIPGRFIDVRAGGSGDTAKLHHRRYWQMDFPDHSQQDRAASETDLIDQYEELMLGAIRRRLEADASVAAYSSGGLDSSLLLSMATHLRGEAPPTLTFNIDDPNRDESAGADILSQHLGHRPEVVDLTGADLIQTFPRLVHAAESPVIDVSAAALFRLAEAAHAQGHKSVLCGEGADEWQAGYPWFRIFKRLRRADVLPGVRLDRLGYWFYARFNGSRRLPLSTLRRSEAACGGPNAWLLAYNLMTTTQYHFFSRKTRESLAGYLPYDDLDLPLESLRRWDALSRSLYLGGRVHLAGLHCHARGDRSTMHSSVQARYPFLDERVVGFLAGLAPEYKLRGTTDKYLQRRLSERWLPKDLVEGRKSLLHSPLDAFHNATPPAFVDQLLSDESLRASGYFDPDGVRRWRERLPHMRHGFARLFIAMGLVGVISTQLWHHWYFDRSMADLPSPPHESERSV